jgi:hypothetical protein
MLNPLAVHEAAQSLLTCVCDALTALVADVPGLAGCPCRVCVVPGAEVAWDGCDGGCDVQPGEFPGQLSVNTVRLFTSDPNQFPREVQPVRDLRGCVPVVGAAELAVTVLRCTPLPTDDGCPPTCDQLSQTAMQQAADMGAVRHGILCCFSATSTARVNGRRYVLGAARTLGPQGGCTGIEQRVTVDLGVG